VKTFRLLEESIIGCTHCVRLTRYCQAITQKKKREFRDDDYWGRPVPGFGDPRAKLWIVGLAPAAHGANRTGRMFTGDSSGRWLYRALHQYGFANLAESTHRDDKLRLREVFISAAARCAPPDNKPLPEEILNCAPYLDAEWRLLTEVRLFLALGAIGFRATCDLMERNGVQFPKPRPKFAHGAEYRLGKHRLLCSYHPSRQNTQTGRLTDAMWKEIFKKARDIVDT